MTNTMRMLNKAMARETAVEQEKQDKLSVSNRLPHRIDIAGAVYEPHPMRPAIRVGDPDARRNAVEVDGLPFPLLEAVGFPLEYTVKAALQVLRDRADVVIVSRIAFEQFVHAEKETEPGSDENQYLRRVLAKIISPSTGKSDRIVGETPRGYDVVGTRRAICHPLFLTEV